MAPEPTPKARAESKAPPVARALATELDSVSDSKGSPEPSSSVLFPPGAPQQVSPKAGVVFTPELLLAEVPTDQDTSPFLTQFFK